MRRNKWNNYQKSTKRGKIILNTYLVNTRYL